MICIPGRLDSVKLMTLSLYWQFYIDCQLGNKRVGNLLKCVLVLQLIYCFRAFFLKTVTSKNDNC